MQSSFTTALLLSTASAITWQPNIANEDLTPTERAESFTCQLTDTACWIDGCDTDAIKYRTVVKEKTYLECINDVEDWEGQVDVNLVKIQKRIDDKAQAELDFLKEAAKSTYKLEYAPWTSWVPT